MPQFELLGTLMRDLHQEFVRLYYLLLPVFFAFGVAATWFRSPQGSIEFLDVLKRSVVATLLLAAFPDISRTIIFIADGITEKIDSLNSLDVMVRMAQEKAQSYSVSTTSVLLQFNDLIIATLSFLSYLVLYIARYLTIAMYHFFWTFFMISAPLLLLFHIFRSTSQITANLFRGMIEVASWKIVWAILGAMLSALSFGDAYQAEGNYLILIVMNFVIAIAMLATPLVVRSLVSSGFQSMASSMGPTVVSAMTAAPAQAVSMAIQGRAAIHGTHGFARNQLEQARNPTSKNRAKL